MLKIISTVPFVSLVIFSFVQTQLNQHLLSFDLNPFQLIVYGLFILLLVVGNLFLLYLALTKSTKQKLFINIMGIALLVSIFAFFGLDVIFPTSEFILRTQMYSFFLICYYGTGLVTGIYQNLARTKSNA